MGEGENNIRILIVGQVRGMVECQVVSYNPLSVTIGCFFVSSPRLATELFLRTCLIYDDIAGNSL